MVDTSHKIMVGKQFLKIKSKINKIKSFRNKRNCPAIFTARNVTAAEREEAFRHCTRVVVTGVAPFQTVFILKTIKKKVSAAREDGGYHGHCCG